METYKKRNQDQINTILKTTGKSQVFEEFLSQDEIDHLLCIYEESEKCQKISGPLTGIPPWDDVVFKGVLEKIEDALSTKVEPFGGNYFRVQAPHGIHNDIPKNNHNIVPGKSIVIPLEKSYRDGTEPKDNDAEFYVFDQMFFHEPVKCFKGGPVMESPWNIPLYEYDDIYGLHDDDRIPSGNFRHIIKKRWLEGLSIEKTCRWKPKDVIVFDCVRLHCASTFTKNNIIQKTGLSIFTSFR